MHSQHQTHADAAWAPSGYDPLPTPYYPGGIEGGQGLRGGWPPHAALLGEPSQQPFFQQQHPTTLGRPQVPNDERSLRLKDEHRRKQHEYSQALAEQVRQRELQKQRERDTRLREDATFEPNQPHGGHARVERGLFDGLGQDNPSQRGNFGRGRRPAPSANVGTQQQPPPPALHTMPSQPQLQQPLAGHVGQYQQEQQQLHGWSGHAEALGLVGPQHQSPAEPYSGMTPRQDASWGGLAPHRQPHQHPVEPPPQHQAHPVGRRVRTDLGTGGLVDDAQTRRRQQQQLDMQDTLRRQIEEKQRQKLEEKHKREDEERRDMEKFEQEKRRQHEEQERLKEEKRRKALADEEHFRTQQQQLEAATAAAAHEQRRHRNHHSPTKADDRQQHHHHSSSSPQRGPQPHHAKPLEKNPFTNSRAHLFQDPPQQTAQLSPHSPARQQLVHQFPPSMQQQHDQFTNDRSTHHPGRQHPPDHDGRLPYHHGHPARQPHAESTVDTGRLLQQYEQVRAELERQRHLVEQLHAQMQQQSRMARDHDPPRELSTVSDLERLRQELRDELEQREVQHRHELESLRRRNSASNQPAQSSLQEDVEQRQPLPLPLRESGGRAARRVKRSIPPRSGPRRRHDAFVQDALDEDGDGDDAVDLSDMGLSNQQPSPLAPRRINPPPPERNEIRKSRVGSSQPSPSLQCESKLVFFDGRVRQPKPDQAEHDAFRLDDSVDELVRRSVAASRLGAPAHGRDRSNQSDADAAGGFERKSGRRTGAAALPHDDSDDDSLEFFIKRLDALDPQPGRYREGTARASTRGGGEESFSLAHGVRESRIVDSPPSASELLLLDIDDEEREEDSDSLDGAALEAIFQRNVRRHEILSGFEAQAHHRAPQPMHWQELRRMLQSVSAAESDVGGGGGRSATRHASHHDARFKEESLAATSRWMPSAVLS